MSIATAGVSLAILAFLVIAVVVGFELFYAAREHKREYEGFMLQGKLEGVRFAEETLRKDPANGDRKLRSVAKNHREIGLAYNESFADGIEEVLYNLANMGRQK